MPITFSQKRCHDNKKVFSSLLDLKLLRLHVERMLTSLISLLNTIDDAKTKYTDDYIFDIRYLVSVTSEMLSFAYSVIYELNAVNGQRNLGLFWTVDKIKGEFHKILSKNNRSQNQPENIPDKESDDEDREYLLLKAILNLASSITLAPPFEQYTGENRRTLGDVVNITIRQLISVLKEMSNQLPNDIPVIYQHSKDCPFKISQVRLDEGEDIGSGPHNSKEIPGRTASSFWEGFSNPKYYIRRLNKDEKSDIENGSRPIALKGEDRDSSGLQIIHKERCLSFFRLPSRCYILQANLSDDITYNRIEFFTITDNSLTETEPQVNILLEKGFRWLDFSCYETGNVFVGNIKNLLREEVEERLLLIGRLMAFLSNLPPMAKTDESPTVYLEMFLESVAD